MKFSCGGFEGSAKLRSVPAELERAGFDTISVIETRHDPFVQAAVVMEHSSSIEIMTTVAIAFARTPMVLAAAAHDLNALSGGRFILGLGSQTKPHITRRFSMPWSHPAERMKETISAIHAIWDSWYDGKPLAFEGQFYSHTLMTPMFTPGDTEFGRPKIHLAAVGPHMTQVAAEVADGLICHSFTTERYIRDVTLPAVEESLFRRGRKRSDLEISVMPLIACGSTDEALENACAETRKQIAFYGSTPAYRAILDLHGWGALHDDLHAMSKQGRWDDMGQIINDEVLATFALVGSPAEIAGEIRRRFAGICERVSLGLGNDPSVAKELLGVLDSARAKGPC